MNSFPFELILASGSPRRKQLLEHIVTNFKIAKTDADETIPNHLFGAEAARYLAEVKSKAYGDVAAGQVVLTADTIVCLDKTMLNKPADYQEAFDMLSTLSGKTHEVITGVCLRSAQYNTCFHATTRVTFKTLSKEEIDYYIRTYEPFDKAGAYGIQEWIGLIGITSIEGSYFNVVGLPVNKVYEALRAF
jgi:septum formation protein